MLTHMLSVVFACCRAVVKCGDFHSIPPTSRQVVAELVGLGEAYDLVYVLGCQIRGVESMAEGL